MSELTTKIQNVGIHHCSDQTAITYEDAVEIREMMKREIIEEIVKESNRLVYNSHGWIIRSIEGVE